MGIAPVGIEWPEPRHDHLLFTTRSADELAQTVAMQRPQFGDGQTVTYA